LLLDGADFFKIIHLISFNFAFMALALTSDLKCRRASPFADVYLRWLERLQMPLTIFVPSLNIRAPARLAYRSAAGVAQEEIADIFIARTTSDKTVMTP
jgi:peptidoglycan/xylan/chitin deacetylase (PgdA/CDA1 family)